MRNCPVSGKWTIGPWKRPRSKTSICPRLKKEKDDKIRQLTDQLAWYRRKFWHPSSEKFIPQDPNQRRIDFDGLAMLPEEEAMAKEAEKEVITYERVKPTKEKKQPVRLPLPDDLRREIEIIEPEGIDENWLRIGEEITELLEHKPGELYVRRIIRPKYALKRTLQQDRRMNRKTSRISGLRHYFNLKIHRL